MSYTTLAGGLRSRMIFDNLYTLLDTNLRQLGWFDAGRRHQPVHFVVESQDVTTEVPVNTLALSDENVNSKPWEIGSQFTEDTRYYYVDFFGESDAVSKHIIGDVRDILIGKFASLGRTFPTLEVYDLRQPTPPKLFYCDIVGVRVDRSHDYTHPWLRHWYSIQFSLNDWYNNDADPTGVARTFGSGTLGSGTFGGD